MAELQRLTTEYIETEDRIRIRGELSSEETVVMWLSQRLLIRLLPHLFLWLEKQSDGSIPADIAQSFAQEAAKAHFLAEEPVVPSNEASDWLVEEVDLTSASDTFTLRFRSNNGQQEILSMQAQQLRQWLEVLFKLWTIAEWPTAIWPNWIGGETRAPKALASKQIH